MIGKWAWESFQADGRLGQRKASEEASREGIDSLADRTTNHRPSSMNHPPPVSHPFDEYRVLRIHLVSPLGCVVLGCSCSHNVHVSPRDVKLRPPLFYKNLCHEAFPPLATCSNRPEPGETWGWCATAFRWPIGADGSFASDGTAAPNPYRRRSWNTTDSSGGYQAKILLCLPNLSHNQVQL